MAVLVIPVLQVTIPHHYIPLNGAIHSDTFKAAWKWRYPELLHKSLTHTSHADKRRHTHLGVTWVSFDVLTRSDMRGRTAAAKYFWGMCERVYGWHLIFRWQIQGLLQVVKFQWIPGWKMQTEFNNKTKTPAAIHVNIFLSNICLCNITILHLILFRATGPNTFHGYLGIDAVY